MRKIVTLAVVVVALALTPLALAGSSTALGGYGGEGSNPVVQVKGAVASKPAKATSAGPSGTLPFTGLDLAYVVGGALALLGLGLGLRRLGRDRLS